MRFESGADMETEEIPTQRRRREDKHPVMIFIARFWIAISTSASIFMAVFLALGFEFKTPAAWLSAANTRMSLLETRQQEQTEEQKETNRLLRILARDVCSRFTREQLRVTPDCDSYARPR